MMLTHPRRLRTLAALAALLAVGTACAEGPPPTDGDDPRGLYSRQPPSRDGIGKVYMGREISFTLDHRGVVWLERPERELEERPDLVIENLGLAPDDVVADLGAGSGYFTFRMSPLVPGGRVLAVDIQQEMLDVIERRRDAEGVANVETVLATVSDPALPEGGVDAVLIVDAYHEFSHPREVMEGVVRGLADGGRVILVEYRGEDPDVLIFPLHKMTQDQVRREMAAVGLRWIETRDMLPQQHFMVFGKAAPAAAGD